MNRNSYIRKIERAFQIHPIVAILGPRQCGKTTLAKIFADSIAKILSIVHFDLENPRDLIKLDNPLLALENQEGLIVIDEIQLRPDLFPVLRVLADKNKKKQKYLILGSASRDLIRQSSESLAGRIAYIELPPFSVFETHEIEKLWVRGGFPLSYLASSDYESSEWRRNYITTFLERDIPALGIKIAPQNLRRFWMMLVHYHGNVFNASAIGNSLGISHTAIRNYLDILSGTFMIRQLMPWQENIKKRQVKAPKIYFRDSGIMHSLLNISAFKDLQNFPQLGASWEGFALEEVIRNQNVDAEDCYFWATHSGAELDLLIVKGQKRVGFEFKYSDSPKVTKSMQIAFDDLHLDNLYLIYPGKDSFRLTEKITAIGLNNNTDDEIRII
jgi:uncharacterized protein